MKFITFFQFFCDIFALLDPDPDPLTLLNPDPIRIRKQCSEYLISDSIILASPTIYCLPQLKYGTYPAVISIVYVFWYGEEHLF
jgi:hypothetical protein